MTCNGSPAEPNREIDTNEVVAVLLFGASLNAPINASSPAALTIDNPSIAAALPRVV
ncbi:MAG: hypothetical protein CM15mP29_0890 [Alphaproteobacteria bacterium]|nr:MAG: hypothetical protein CM15mP29_0890 [Alphaproteobacteria bacterium]